MSSTHIKIEEEIQFLCAVKQLLKEQILTSGRPDKAPINLCDTVNTYIRVMDVLEELEEKDEILEMDV